MRWVILAGFLAACGGPDLRDRRICVPETAQDCHRVEPASGAPCADCAGGDASAGCAVDGVTDPAHSTILAGQEYVCCGCHP